MEEAFTGALECKEGGGIIDNDGECDCCTVTDVPDDLQRLFFSQFEGLLTALIFLDLPPLIPNRDPEETERDSNWRLLLARINTIPGSDYVQRVRYTNRGITIHVRSWCWELDTPTSQNGNHSEEGAEEYDEEEYEEDDDYLTDEDEDEDSYEDRAKVDAQTIYVRIAKRGRGGATLHLLSPHFDWVPIKSNLHEIKRIDDPFLLKGLRRFNLVWKWRDVGYISP